MERMVLSWGRAHRLHHNVIHFDAEQYRQQITRLTDASLNQKILAHGYGRSYGDVALNDGGTLVMTRRLKHLLQADWKTGRIRAAAGLSFDELLQICVPKGWFIPVSPGTKFVTLGGAVANDVHGKNHHKSGSFGAHLYCFQLYRSDRGELICSPDENKDLFEMTIGGLGLTGIIDWVEFQLSPIPSAYLDVENLRCPNLSDFFRLSEESNDWPYTVMWVDCFAQRQSLGRGIFSRARWASEPPAKKARFQPHTNKSLPWPFPMPSWTLNRYSISAFNMLYRNRPAAHFKGRQHYDPFFYPLDKLLGWNKLYGKRGFFQHQCIIPMDNGEAGIKALLQHIAKAGQGSFLAVLKVHGPKPSPGIMSFCLEGVSLALDFANRGSSTLALLDQLDDIVLQHGGRCYAAKDGRMQALYFQATYPRWRELEAARDVTISSSFWRRVTAQC